MCDHYGQTETWTFALDNINLFFIVVFTSEMLLKMFALGKLYLYLLYFCCTILLYL